MYGVGPRTSQRHTLDPKVFNQRAYPCRPFWTVSARKVAAALDDPAAAVEAACKCCRFFPTVLLISLGQGGDADSMEAFPSNISFFLGFGRCIFSIGQPVQDHKTDLDSNVSEVFATSSRSVFIVSSLTRAG